MKKGILFGSVVSALLIPACNHTIQPTNDMEKVAMKETSLFPKGDPGSADYFTGDVSVQMLVSPDQIEGLYSVGSVTFEPGGKTNWHTHPAGQILLVTDGKGFYQERGKPAQSINKGSVVVIPKDVEHWHGAAHDTPLVHIAISNMADGSNVTWLTPVTDEEYEGVKE